MNSEQMKSKLKEADELLSKYVKLVKPVAKELAIRKSRLNNKKFKYTGELGCWEMGVDSICLHIVGTKCPNGDERNVISRFEQELHEEFGKELEYIKVSGHY